MLIELCASTFATNAPGTNSTSVTPVQLYGRAITVGATAAKNWTAEPTALTVIEETLCTPYGGQVWYDFPLGDGPDSPVSNGFVLRFTAPAAVNVRASMTFERC
ncbi:hypothetical protein MXD61_06785 [Frankia sp. AgPm24]|uniref:hypothetical protein n=1 Tax=Frankia sp. AgPm24 TaxID=631128 RepID=UPI00200F9C7B|nr:hypothetical protein [Frankia sp. AgPm24]MCK9921596.1 hypothetical protein [Frankia sp. AgPm24]